MRFLRPLIPTLLLATSVVACGADGAGSLGFGEPSSTRAIPPNGDVSDETYGKLVENDWVETATEPVSTFGADVDTGSYSLMRRDVRAGRLPNPDSVRVEEYITTRRRRTTSHSPSRSTAHRRPSVRASTSFGSGSRAR